MKFSGYPREYLEFIELFNQEKFFEAHEILELRWKQERGKERAFYQGLIQIAAAFVHLQKGTPLGAEELLKSASRYLEKFKPVFMNLDLEKLLTEAQASLSAAAPFPRLPAISFYKKTS